MMSESHLPHPLFDLFLAAQVDQGLAARFRRVQALLDLQLD